MASKKKGSDSKRKTKPVAVIAPSLFEDPKPEGVPFSAEMTPERFHAQAPAKKRPGKAGAVKSIAPAQSPDDARLEAIHTRLVLDLQKMGLTAGNVKNFHIAERTLKDAAGNKVHVNLAGLGDRAATINQPRWFSVRDRKKRGSGDAAKITSGSIPANFKLKLDNEEDILNSYWGYVGLIEPEYDLLEGWTLLDTEAFYRQAISRKMSLAFRNGAEVVGDNQDFVQYVERRMKQMGYMMNQKFLMFLKEILLNLMVASNCIVIKIRDSEASGGYPNDKNGNMAPVAGYKIVPTQTIFPFLDGKGRIEKWRRFFGMGRPFKDYPNEDVIHFQWERKPGHLFGTPRHVSFRDDIFALRRLEENIELLMVHHLFPLFHVAVGTEKAPCQYTVDGMSEIDKVRMLIQEMPKEGVFVTDERVKIDVHGAAKEGIDPNPILAHYKKRIFTGMGVSPLDLGEADTGNRATAENVSQNLKDSIKADLDWFGAQVSMFLFKEWFQEAPSALSVQNAVADVALEWHEIDVDTQIKKETHAANMFNNHGLDQNEYRKRMKLKPLNKEQDKTTHFGKHVVGIEKVKHGHAKEILDIQHEHAIEQQNSAPQTKTTKVTRKHVNGASSTREITEPVKKAVANLMQPTNQHGKNLDPHKARSSQDPDLLKKLYDGFLSLSEMLSNEDQWDAESASMVDAMFPGPEMLSVRETLKSYVRISNDADLLWANLTTWALHPIPGESEEGLLAAAA
jgi:hypothetical protein